MKIILKRKKLDETELLQKSIRELKARIEDLKRENTDLLFSLDEYTKKENSILESIGYLEEKKREQTESLNKKYALELQKLRFFEEKWLNIVRNSNDPSLFAAISFTRESLKNCRDEILKTTRKELKISKDLTAAEEDFTSETVRLNNLKAAKSTNFSEETFSPSEFAKYRKVLKTAEEKDAVLKRELVAPASESNDNLAETFYRRFGVPLSSAHRKYEDNLPENTANGISRDSPFCDSEINSKGIGEVKNIRGEDFKSFGDNKSNSAHESKERFDSWKSPSEDVEAEFGNFPPRRDKTDAVPITEPETQVSPRKMSDKEIVSLLEKLSV